MFKDLRDKLKQKMTPEIELNNTVQMFKDLRSRLKERLILEHKKFPGIQAIEVEELKGIISSRLEDILSSQHITLTTDEKEAVIIEVLYEFTGLGPLQKLLKDPLVTEIMINGPNRVYIEKEGRTIPSEITFDSTQQLMHLIQKILSNTRRRVDESHPYTEVAFVDGSRINIVIPPLALNGPTVTIRKFLREIKGVEDLVKLGTMDERMGNFLVACIKAKLNIIFAGATGAGKTTTLNVLSAYIPNDDRIVTIEDTAELHLAQDHVVRLEARQASIEGKGEISIRSLFKNSLRMRPDRIILGEIRGEEALDMLQAICSGHSGSLSVIHANSPQDVIYRIETMVLTSGVPITLESIHRQIIGTIHLIVQQEQLLDGSRKITNITQINGLKDGQVVLEDIFSYKIEEITLEGKVKGWWRSSGRKPVFYDLFKRRGIVLSEEIFKE